MAGRPRTLRVQAAEELRRVIADDYRPGDRLPAEAVLAQRIGLSRNTVREAIGLLVSEGVVDRRWGVGTTVLTPSNRASFPLDVDVVSMRETIAASGRIPAVGRFSMESSAPPAPVASALRLTGTEQIWRVDRVLTIDGVPGVHLEDWCLPELRGRPFDPSPVAKIENDLIQQLYQQTGAVLRRLDGRVSAVIGGSELTPPMSGAPLIRLEQTGYLTADQPVVYTVVQYDTASVDLWLRRVIAS